MSGIFDIEHGGYPDPPNAPSVLNRMLSRDERDAIVTAALASHEHNFKYARRARSKVRDGYGKLHDQMVWDYDLDGGDEEQVAW